VLQPPLGPLTDRGASIDVDGAAVELVTQGAESLSSFAPCGCGDGAADTLPGGGIAPDLEDGEPLTVTGALEDRPLAVTSPTSQRLCLELEAPGIPVLPRRGHSRRRATCGQCYGVRGAVGNGSSCEAAWVAFGPDASTSGSLHLHRRRVPALNEAAQAASPLAAAGTLLLRPPAPSAHVVIPAVVARCGNRSHRCAPAEVGLSLRSVRVQPFSAVPTRIAPDPTELRAEPAVVGSG
jgi:hypothetical protein